MNQVMNTKSEQSKLNNILRTVCAVLLLFCVVDAIYKIASIPLFYQRAVTQSLPEIIIEGFIQASNSGVVQEASERGMLVSDYLIYRIASDLVYALGFYIVAILILRRAQGKWFLWFTALILIFVPSGQLNYYTPVDMSYNRYLMVLSLLWPAYPLFLYLFPNGRAVPGWMRWLIIPVLVLHLLAQGIASLVLVTGWRTDLIPVFTPYLPVILLSFPLVLIAQVYRYLRVSTREERLQTKWVVGGLACVVLIPYLFSNQTDIQGDYGFLGDFVNMLTLLIPVTIGISILRYRLYNIDLIIRRTLQYGLLSLLLGLIYFGLVVLLGQAFQGATGQQSPLVIVISSLVIAALFNPLRRRVQMIIDRRFFRGNYNVEQAIERFSATARSETDIVRLSAALPAVVEETVQPESISLWLRPTPGNRQQMAGLKSRWKREPERSSLE